MSGSAVCSAPMVSRSTRPRLDGPDMSTPLLDSTLWPLEHAGFSPRYVLGPAVITGTIIKNVTAQKDTTTHEWVVVLNYTA